MKKKEEKTKELQKDVAGRIRKFISDGKAKKGLLFFDANLPNDWRLEWNKLFLKHCPFQRKKQINEQ